MWNEEGVQEVTIILGSQGQFLITREGLFVLGRTIAWTI